VSLHKYFLVLLFGVCLTSPSWAAIFSTDVPDLQKALSVPTLTIEGYELSKDELNSFYAVRHYKPAWNLIWQNDQAAFAAFIDSVEKLINYHGLQREDYAIALMQKLALGSDSDTHEKLEFFVTDTVIRLAHDLHGDTIDLAELYPGWTYHRNELDIPLAVATAVESNQLKELIDRLTPQDPAYRDLAVALQTYNGMMTKNPWSMIDPGPTLRPNDKGLRVEQLRQRLMAENYLPPSLTSDQSNQIFDETLHQAVLVYQSRNGLDPDGNLGPKTLEALNIPLHTRLDQIKANMERWRHIPDAFPPSRYALVNIPDFSLTIYTAGKPLYHGPVIIGQVVRKTPFIQSAIRSMIVNPFWHVPSKIARKDILPKLKKDPHYLEKLGFVISGSKDDPHGDTIDWQSIHEREFDFHLRQAPGDMNSLGRLKFDFDNDFSVYMHGTPHQELFKKFERDLSSGCIRLRDPEQVAAIVLADNKDPWDVKKIEEEIQTGKTRWVGLANPLPLSVLYWTVFQGDDGYINFRNDIYGYDRFLMETMRGLTPVNSHKHGQD
jgi:L,D-transpeptidase YcbB